MGIVRPHLWFDDQAARAARFYAEVIPNTVIHSVTTAPPGTPGVAEGSEFIVELTIDGMRATFLNAGPTFTLDEAFSFVLDCADQAEIDHYWETLTADGGKPSQCGWLVDKFGVFWQIVPKELGAMIAHKDKARSGRTMQAMMGMKKLDLVKLQAAFDGV